ncbi:hypothetical protein [Streptomyces sp. JJ36]|uniref:hypothetical protein n=1 Tax=Streptomyces sp. JJ36 TaxID=2736645 RepID=UPI001F3E6047|nr:hypothetical protein [Streptomyces sp. JJ36]MCF6523822.1 hypothetical protein [Streptomyces sp. JJ36]
MVARSDDGWGNDAVRMMAGAGRDPREWLSIDAYVRSDAGGESRPFRPVSGRDMEGSLNAVSRDTARSLLVILSSGEEDVRHIPDFESNRQRLYGCSDTVLSRFGPDAQFWTSVDDPPEESDGTDLRVSEWYALTVESMDLGLVAVSPTEVGVFWICNPL